MLNKIICVGDSITRGKVWRENEKKPCVIENSYPKLLKTFINIDVENSGVCDITSEEMLKRVGNDIKFEKDSAVIIELGGNDCNLNWRDIKKDPDGEHEAIVPVEKFKNNIIKMIEIVKQCGAMPILSTLPPLDAERYFNLLKRVFGEGIKRWIDKNGGIYKWQERYSDAVKSIAALKDIYLIDTRKAFLETDDYRKYMSIDGVHPNEDGYLLIAKTCYEALNKVLFIGNHKIERGMIAQYLV